MRKRVEEPEKPANHERWLITYADMVTLLMALFIVLYAVSVADQTKFDKLAESLSQAFGVEVLEGNDPDYAVPNISGSALFEDIRRDLNSLQDRLDALQAVGPGSGGVSAKRNREGILISLYGNFLFDSGKATVNDEALSVLEAVVAEIDPDHPIRVEGHTDNIPIDTVLYPSNWELSSARATSVVRSLIELGVKPERLQAAGYGENRPVVDNDSRDNRARNRRVDLQITYPTTLDALTDGSVQDIPGVQTEVRR